MGSKWTLAASVAALAIIGAAGEVQAQSATQWDRKAEPLEGRPSEYRTTTTDTWIRLSPYGGGLIWDRGSQLASGYQFGLALEFEPADVLIASFDFGSNLPIPDFGTERAFKRKDGAQGHEEQEGWEHHFALYVGLKNPEIRAGIMQPIIGVGGGAFYLHGYKPGREGFDSTQLVDLTGQFVDPPRFPVQWIWHGTLFLRFDFEVSDHFAFGFNFKNHVIVYTSTVPMGKLEADKFDFQNMRYAFEPSFYLSLRF